MKKLNHIKTLFLTIIFITINLNLMASSHIQKSSVTSIEKELKIALILWRGETKAEIGFKQKLKDLGYKVKYTTYDAQNKRFEFPTILRKVKFENFDYIYTFGTSASQMTKHLLNNKVPQIFNIVSSPQETNIVKYMNATGGNISGVSNKVSLEVQIQTALQIIKFKRLALFFNPREANSMIIRSKLILLGQKYQFEVVSLRSPTLTMLQSNLDQLVKKQLKVDAVYLPADSFIVSNAKLIGQELRAAKLKSIAAIKEYVEYGALIGTVVDYSNLGKMAAMILHDHQNGTKLENIPVQMQKKPSIVLNKTTCDLLDVKIDQKIMFQTFK